MKKFSFLAFIFFCYFSNAQNLIAIDHNGSSSFFSTFDSAYKFSQNGDSLYLPGGSFTILDTITKNLHIYGAGYDADSSTGIGITIITNTLNIYPGASNGSLEGIKFFADIVFNNDETPNAVSGFTVSYCLIMKELLIDSSSNGVISNDFLIRNCYIGTEVYGNLSNSLIANNVLDYYGIAIASNNTITNNLFFGSYPPGYSGAGSSSCTYQNNIFQDGYGLVFGCSNSIFNNNINAYFDAGSGNTGASNVYEAWSNTFINPGIIVGSNPYSYDVHNNYHLNTTSLGHNAGTDGTDMGIYGGPFPWKDGSMPSNPHIVSRSVKSTTDQTGNLPVNITVEAQNH